VVNFPTRGIGARTIEQLQDAAKRQRPQPGAERGRGGGQGGQQPAGLRGLVDGMREATRGLTLREIIEHVLQHSGLLDFYRTDKEGQDRIENLEELVNAAEAFVTQEGFRQGRGGAAGGRAARRSPAGAGGGA
jgi:DNA helicase-2/ATP-dependent DNA helicase PcrA